ncbi:hypothetical protein Btru_056794 [Bulinus truncatus]|nr:hypothetical protein Btru_056794 [Bulinus truncatus]
MNFTLLNLTLAIQLSAYVNRSATLNYGNRCAILNYGNRCAILNYGNRSANLNYVNRSANLNYGNRSANLNHLNRSANLNYGNRNANLNHVNRSANLNCGNRSANLNYVNRSNYFNNVNKSTYFNNVNRSSPLKITLIDGLDFNLDTFWKQAFINLSRSLHEISVDLNSSLTLEKRRLDLISSQGIIEKKYDFPQLLVGFALFKVLKFFQHMNYNLASIYYYREGIKNKRFFEIYFSGEFSNLSLFDQFKGSIVERETCGIDLSPDFYFVESYLVRILKCFINPTLAVLGIAQNVLCAVILKADGFRKPFNLILLAIIIAGIFQQFLAINIPELIEYNMGQKMYRRWKHFMCVKENIPVLQAIKVVFVFFGLWGQYTFSPLFMLIAIERLVAVFLPLKLKSIVTKRNVLYCILFVYVIWLPWVICKSYFSYKFDAAYSKIGAQESLYFHEIQKIVLMQYMLGAEITAFVCSKCISLPLVLAGSTAIAIKIKFTLMERSKLSSTKSKVQWSNRTTKTLVITCSVFSLTELLLFVLSYSASKYIRFTAYGYVIQSEIIKVLQHLNYNLTSVLFSFEALLYTLDRNVTDKFFQHLNESFVCEMALETDTSRTIESRLLKIMKCYVNPCLAVFVIVAGTFQQASILNVTELIENSMVKLIYRQVEPFYCFRDCVPILQAVKLVFVFFGLWGQYVFSSVYMLITTERLVAVFLPLKLKNIVTTKSVLSCILLVYFIWLPWVIYKTYCYNMFDSSLAKIDMEFIRSGIQKDLLSCYSFDMDLASFVFCKCIPLPLVLLGSVAIAIKIKISLKKRAQLSSAKSSGQWSNRTTKTLIITCSVLSMSEIVLFLLYYTRSAWAVISSNGFLMQFEFVSFSYLLTTCSTFFIYVLTNKKLFRHFISMKNSLFN